MGAVLSASAAPRRRAAAAILFAGLALAAAAGFHFSVMVFYGVDLLFGSVASLAGALLIGPAAGALIAGIGVLFADDLLTSPLFFAAFVLEPLAVGVAVRRWRCGPVLVDLAFWVVIGAPMMALAYRWQFGLDWWSVLLAAAKAVLNGGAAALIAALCVHAVGAAPALAERLALRPQRLRDLMFNAIFAAALLAGAAPILALTDWERREAEADLADRLNLKAQVASKRLSEAWGDTSPDAAARAALEATTLQRGAGIAVLGVDGEVLAARGALRSLPPGPGVELVARRADLQLLRPVGPAPELVQWREARFLTTALVSGAPGVALVIVEAPAIDLVETVRTLRQPFFFLAADLFFVGLLVAFLLSRLLSRPIQAIERASVGMSEAIASGQRPALPATRVEEFAALTETLNRMGAELSESFAALKRSQAQALEAKENAERASQSKSAFLATVSHELRTPLNAIIGFSDIMRSEAFGPIGSDRYRDYAGDVNAAGTHLLRLVDDILDITAVEAGSFRIEPVPVRLESVMEEVLKGLGPSLAKKGLGCTFEPEPGLPEVRADVTRIRQVFENLVGNALKYTPAGGSIAVSVGRAGGDAVQAVVRDTGVGIPKSQLARVTEPFVRVGSSLTADAGGVGLGLAIAKSIVELHGGVLIIRSDREQGAEVTVRLPISGPPAERR